jgi:hypothetical protein
VILLKKIEEQSAKPEREWHSIEKKIMADFDVHEEKNKD